MNNERMNELEGLAVLAAGKSYSPFSHFPVGAALWTKAGGTYLGTNVENVSFGLTICAERSAIFTAVAHEGPDMRVEAVAVHCVKDPSVGPCGACRQVIMEFSEFDTPILYGGVSHPMGYLLPLAFKGEGL